MKVFISWSGDRSQLVAEALALWLQSVIQAIQPWISTQDINRGAGWFQEIATSLNSAALGIVCLTRENKDRPWVLFEAGALANGLSQGRVCTLLIDLEPSDVQGPLSHFNHTKLRREDVLRLCHTINQALGQSALGNTILDASFDAHWPRVAKQFDEVIMKTEGASTSERRTVESMVAELLETTRSIGKRIDVIESNARPMPVDEIKNKLAGLEKMIGAIETPTVPYGRPKSFVSASEFHSVSAPVRRKHGIETNTQPQEPTSGE